jgi:hypothetical protein
MSLMYSFGLCIKLLTLCVSFELCGVRNFVMCATLWFTSLQFIFKDELIV